MFLLQMERFTVALLQMKRLTASEKFHTRKSQISSEIKQIQSKADTFLLENKKMILLGVINKVRTLRRGKGGPPKSVLACIGGRGGFSCKRMYAIAFFFAVSLQSRNKANELFRQPKLSIPISPVQLKVQLRCRGSSWCFESTFSVCFAQQFLYSVTLFVVF